MTQEIGTVALRARVDAALADFLSVQRHRLASIDPALAPVAGVLTEFVAGGKRLRPSFAYWGFIGAGGRDSPPLAAALAALELVQASALIHDDLIDASATRRGAPAVHRSFAQRHRRADWAGDPEAFGAAAAILLGDLCLVWSDELLNGCGLDPATLGRARPVFDEMRTELTVGQYLDVLAQVAGDMSVGRAGKVARYKSAKYTVERPLLIGAALAGAGDEVNEAYSGYGLALGEAFQLRDDVLGVFGDPRRTGKPAGDDLREGKRTYLIAEAFAAADPVQRSTLASGLGDQELDESRLAQLREIITVTGALGRTERRIEILTERALFAIGSVELAGDADQELRALAVAATDRTG